MEILGSISIFGEASLAEGKMVTMMMRHELFFFLAM
jgi:hypothetical protein